MMCEGGVRNRRGRELGGEGKQEGSEMVVKRWVRRRSGGEGVKRGRDS